MDLSRERSVSSGKLRLRTADHVEDSVMQCDLFTVGRYLRGGCVTGIFYCKQTRKVQRVVLDHSL